MRKTIALLAILLQVLAAQATAAPSRWDIFPIARISPTGIASGPDHSLWISLQACCGKQATPGLLRVGLAGQQSFVSLPQTDIFSIATGSDGRLYVSDDGGFGGEDVGAYDPKTRIFVEYPAQGEIESNLASGGPYIWFEQYGFNVYYVARMSRSGKITQFKPPVEFGGSNVAFTEFQGGEWFADGSEIVRIDIATGKMTAIPLTNPLCTYVSFLAPSGNSLWAWCGTYFALIVPTGVFEPVVGPFADGPSSLTSAPDGNLYFGSGSTAALGEFDPSRGDVVQYYTPNGEYIQFVTIGPDGNVWGVMGNALAVARFSIKGFRTVGSRQWH
jgi:hypothetical protein